MAARFASRNGLLDVYLSYIFMEGFLSGIKLIAKTSSFSFLSRVCSRSYHLRDDRQIFCYEFLRRYICVLCRVVPYSGEVREFLQLPPRPRPQGLLVFQNEKILETRCFSKHSNTCPKFNSKSATPDLFFTQQGCQ